MNKMILGHRPAELHDTARLPSMTRDPATVEIALSAVLVSVVDDEPRVLTVDRAGAVPGQAAELPSSMFSPSAHTTLEAGFEACVADWSDTEMRHVEQLVTFASRNGRGIDRKGMHSAVSVSVGYMALARPTTTITLPATRWTSWYEFFPWEDWRRGRPRILGELIEPRLLAWATAERGSAVAANGNGRTIDGHDRGARLRIDFGIGGGAWDEEKVAERLELLIEAGIVEGGPRGASTTSEVGQPGSDRAGRPMQPDHRRILAAAIGRLRTRIKSRPIVFELLDDEFTLFELQKTVEAILGPHLHKQNFRRLVSTTGLVEPTRDVRVKTGGRPAKLFRYRPEVALERAAPGVRIRPGRS